MDEVAEAADVSRATLYRLVPGKPALLREVVRTYSPRDSVADLLDQAEDSVPERIVPEVGRLLAASVGGVQDSSWGSRWRC